MCELQRTLDNEMKLQEFLGVKGQFRETSDLDVKQEADRQAKKQEMEEKVAAYTQILNAVKQFTGLNNFIFLYKNSTLLNYSFRE